MDNKKNVVRFNGFADCYAKYLVIINLNNPFSS